jgi:hypothetical protein
VRLVPLCLARPRPNPRTRFSGDTPVSRDIPNDQTGGRIEQEPLAAARLKDEPDERGLWWLNRAHVRDIPPNGRHIPYPWPLPHPS